MDSLNIFYLFFRSTRLSPAIGQINHPGGSFYWLISQLRFHEQPTANAFTLLITHTFKIFIIKGIRVCACCCRCCCCAYLGGFAWLRFIPTRLRWERLAVCVLPSILHQADAAAAAAALFHAWVLQSLRTPLSPAALWSHREQRTQGITALRMR